MTALVIIVAIAYAVVGAVVLFLVRKLSETKEQVFTARREAVQAKARYEAARKSARAAEQRCRQLLSEIELSIVNTGQALDVAEQIAAVSDELHVLTSYVLHPFEAPASQGRHAIDNDAPLELMQ